MFLHVFGLLLLEISLAFSKPNSSETMALSNRYCHYANQWIEKRNEKYYWHGIQPTMLKGVEKELPPIVMAHYSDAYENPFTYHNIMV